MSSPLCKLMKKAQRKNKIAQQIEQHEKIILELQKEAEETQKIDKKYQKLRRPRIRKSVKRMVQEYEDNLKEAKHLILQNEAIDTKYQQLMKPGKIIKLDKAFKVSFDHMRLVSSMTDSLLQLNGSNKAIESRLKALLIELKGFKLNMTLFKRSCA